MNSSSVREGAGAAVIAVGVVMLTIGVIWGTAELGYRLFQHYAPRNEQVRRETYEQSRAFQEGTIRDLENLQVEYASATPAGKAAIRSVALHRLADVPPDLLTPNLIAFAAQLRSDGQ